MTNEYRHWGLGWLKVGQKNPTMKNVVTLVKVEIVSRFIMVWNEFKIIKGFGIL